jgi:hypothetical protein
VYELSQGKEGQKYRDGLKVQPRLSFAVVCVCVLQLQKTTPDHSMGISHSLQTAQC